MAKEKSKPITTAIEVRTRLAGLHGAGNGLYLVVNNPSESNPKGARQWQFRFTSPATKKRREMGLGAAGDAGLSLAEAREKASDLRRMIGRGQDPIDAARGHREAERAASEAEPAKTFGSFAEEWMDGNLGEYRNEKHRAQWRMTLREYAKPLWNLSLEDITPAAVESTLRPIWTEKPETAKRTQGRIERVMGAAIAKGLRSGDNPASWQGRLKHILPRRRKLSRGHHAALPYKEVPVFMAELRQRKGDAARALEFLILTAARSGEVRNATWDEIDLEERRWTLPAERMKAGRPHRVPLSEPTLEILFEMALAHGKEGVIFPGAKQGKPMSDMTLDAVLKRMNRKSVENITDPKTGEVRRRTTGITVHGFRSAFRDWAEDVAGFPHGAIEAALAHTIRNQTEAAYRRGDAYDRRIDLMDTWGIFTGSANYPKRRDQVGE